MMIIICEKILEYNAHLMTFTSQGILIVNFINIFKKVYLPVISVSGVSQLLDP